MTRQRGSIPLAVMIGVGIILFVIIALAVCTDAIFEDEDEENDLGWAGPVATADNRDDNRNGDCRKSRGYCSDDDQMVVNPVICIEPGSCRFEGGGDGDRPAEEADR